MCTSFPLLSAPHSLFSTLADLKTGVTRNDSWPSIYCPQPRAAERHSLVHNVVINKLQAVTDCAYEKEFYHFECLKSLRNIPELQLQEYCNILKKLKEEFVVHMFKDFHSYDSSFNLFSNPMQINILDDSDTWGCLHHQQHLYVLKRTSRSLTQGLLLLFRLFTLPPI